MKKHSNRSNHVDLNAIARQTMIEAGFVADFEPAVLKEVEALSKREPASSPGDARDLRALVWSSIDNTTSRDLDQVEYAEALSGDDTRLLIGVADVDAYVSKDSAIDKHAATNGTSVYTGVRVFPMLPEELSTDLTSLNPDEDRLALVTELVVAHDGVVKKADIYRAAGEEPQEARLRTNRCVA